MSIGGTFQHQEAISRPSVSRPRGIGHPQPELVHQLRLRIPPGHAGNFISGRWPFGFGFHAETLQGLDHRREPQPTPGRPRISNPAAPRPAPAPSDRPAAVTDRIGALVFNELTVGVPERHQAGVRGGIGGVEVAIGGRMLREYQRIVGRREQHPAPIAVAVVDDLQGVREIHRGILARLTPALPAPHPTVSCSAACAAPGAFPTRDS